MPREGYTNLSIESKRYAHNRRMFDSVVKTDLTYSAWVMDILDASILREKTMAELFPKLHFVGKKKDGGIVIDDGHLIEIEIKNKKFVCSHHNEICEHIIFAVMHPLFTD